MGPTQSRLAVGDLIFDARGPEGGPVVVLLHGWPEFSSWWRDSLEALGGAGYRAVAFDQRGYSRGARPLDVAEYCPDRLVDDVLGIAGAVGAQSFHMVAHDWGGMVAWALATSYPQRLKSLTVLSTPHPIALQESRKADPKQDRRLDYVRFFRLRDGSPGRPCLPTEPDGCALHSTRACRKTLLTRPRGGLPNQELFPRH